MSHKKPKHAQNNPPAKQQQHASETETTNRHVYVEPGVQIDFVKDLKEKYAASQEESGTHDKKILFWTKISAILLFIYVGLTLLTYRATVFTLIDTNRAYLGFTDIQNNLVADVDRTKEWEFDAPFLNNGNTPAEEAASYAGADVLTQEPTEDQFVGPRDSVRSLTSVPSKGYQTVGPINRGDGFVPFPECSKGIPVQIPLSPGTRYFWGWVIYRDVFSKDIFFRTKPHLTEFCRALANRQVICSDKEGLPANMRWSFTNCSQHNCTDEHCKDYKSITKLMNKP